MRGRDSSRQLTPKFTRWHLNKALITSGVRQEHENTPNGAKMTSGHSALQTINKLTEIIYTLEA